MYICVYKYVKMFLLVCSVFIIQWVYHVTNKCKFHAVLSTIFSQLILLPIFSQPMFNSYSAMLSSWLYLTLLVAKWKPTLNMWWYSTSDTIPGNTPRPKSVMGRNPGITSPYAKTQDYIIFRTPTQMKYHSLFGTPSRENGIIQEPVHQFASQAIYWFSYGTSFHWK